MKLSFAFHSIRWRVQILHGLLLAAVLTVLGVAAFFVLLDRFMRDVDNEIYAVGFSAYRGMRDHSRVALSSAELERSGMYILIWKESGTPSWRSDAAPEAVPEPSGTGDGFRTRDWRFREYYMPLDLGGWVLAGRSLLPDYARWSRVILMMAGVGALLWGGAMAIGWFLIGRALRPVDSIAETAEQIAEGDLSLRIDTPDRNSELGRLAAVLNSCFTRLEESFERQRRFTADAAHELRTPTAIVLAHAQSGLQSPALSPEDRSAFEACERAALRMKRLVEGLLQLARSDAGQRPVLVECDLAHVARDAVDLLREAAARRGIELQTDLAAAPVAGDPLQLGQVVANLVDNALTYHDKPEGFVCVSVRAESSEAVCEVTDDGPGIAPEHLPHVFERFYRVDKARSSRGGHTGLGLAISSEIVKAHHGTIGVESTVACGSVFHFRLPLASSNIFSGSDGDADLSGGPSQRDKASTDFTSSHVWSAPSPCPPCPPH